MFYDQKCKSDSGVTFQDAEDEQSEASEQLGRDINDQPLDYSSQHQCESPPP
jgi:hypothetical protein